MNLPYDSLREAVLLELNRAIRIRRARGASFEALRKDFGLSKQALDLVRARYRGASPKRVVRARLRSRSRSRLSG